MQATSSTITSIAKVNNSAPVGYLMLGAAGAGKSTLINRMLGSAMAQISDEIDTDGTTEVAVFHRADSVTFIDTPGLDSMMVNTTSTAVLDKVLAEGIENLVPILVVAKAITRITTWIDKFYRLWDEIFLRGSPRYVHVVWTNEGTLNSKKRNCLERHLKNRGFHCRHEDANDIVIPRELVMLNTSPESNAETKEQPSRNPDGDRAHPAARTPAAPSAPSSVVAPARPTATAKKMDPVRQDSARGHQVWQNYPSNLIGSFTFRPNRQSHRQPRQPRGTAMRTCFRTITLQLDLEGVGSKKHKAALREALIHVDRLRQTRRDGDSSFKDRKMMGSAILRLHVYAHLLEMGASGGLDEASNPYFTNNTSGVLARFFSRHIQSSEERTQQRPRPTDEANDHGRTEVVEALIGFCLESKKHHLYTAVVREILSMGQGRQRTRAASGLETKVNA